MNLYQFDRDLRIAALRGLERVEIGVRAILVEKITRGRDCFAHRDRSVLGVGISRSGSVVFDPQKWLEDLDASVTAEKNETFIQHFRDNYSDFPRVPCWMALELANFGDLSRIYSGCNIRLRDEMARMFAVDESVLGSWILTLSNVRNICAHHGRLWNRAFRVNPLIVRGRGREYWRDVPRDRIFIRLAIMRHMLRVLHDDDEWTAQIEGGFSADFSDPRKAVRMGFPCRLDAANRKELLDWKNHPLWARDTP